jgi:hypothetical protein
VTMLLVIVTPLAIYMAADSKQYPSGDNTEKIFLVGNDAIVMHSGRRCRSRRGGAFRLSGLGAFVLGSCLAVSTSSRGRYVQARTKTSPI